MYKFTQRSPITIILLSIVTCGIYFIYWLYVTSKEINDALGREEINTVLGHTRLFLLSGNDICYV